ncbi:MAG: hypothetical protein U0793_25020 [Gemmataceae bacterium]
MDTHLTPLKEQEAKELEARIRQVAMEKEIATSRRGYGGKPIESCLARPKLPRGDIRGSQGLRRASARKNAIKDRE